MVKLGCLILSMVEGNLVGRGQLISFGDGMGCDTCSSFISYFDNSSYKPLVQYDLYRGDSVEFLFNLYTCVLIMFLVASGFEINLGCYIILPEAVRK